MKKIIFFNVEIYNDERTTNRWQSGTDIFDCSKSIYKQAEEKAFEYSKLEGKFTDFKYKVVALTPLFDVPPEKYPIRRKLKKVN